MSSDGSPPRRTGVVAGGTRRHRPSRSRHTGLGWVAVIGSLLASVLVLGWMLGLGRPTGEAVISRPTPEPVAPAPSDAAEATTSVPSYPFPSPSPALTHPPTPTRTPAPRKTPATTSTPTPRQTLSPTPTPRVTPTPTTPTPDPTPAPPPSTAPTTIAGLSIDFPKDGAIVRTGAIDIIGSAPPGATVTRDVPLWFDEHVTAGTDGRWSLPARLTMGENRLTFRIGDERATEQVLIVFRAS